MSKSSSQAKTAANQQNAKASTGPRTAEGKATSSRNAMKHGLTSAQVLLPHEDAEAYERLHADFIKQYGPISETEETLLHRAADAFWRLRRTERVEAEFLRARMEHLEKETGLKGDRALAELFLDEGEAKRLRTLMRYRAAAQREWERAMKDYQAALDARPFSPEELADWQHDMMCAAAMTPDGFIPGVGFVSNDDPKAPKNNAGPKNSGGNKAAA